VLTVSGQGDNPKYLKPLCFFIGIYHEVLEHDHLFFTEKNQSFWNTEKLEFMDLGFLFQKMVQVTLLKGHRFFCYTKSWIAGEILEKFIGNSPQTKYGYIIPPTLKQPRIGISTSLSFKFGF